MGIRTETKSDAMDIIGFADELASLYDLAVRLQTKIATYGTAVAAIGAGMGTPRQERYAAIVQTLIAAEDIPRIAALVPMLTDWIDLIENNYRDFVGLE